jgi:hypothetical protein
MFILTRASTASGLGNAPLSIMSWSSVQTGNVERREKVAGHRKNIAVMETIMAVIMTGGKTRSV